MKHKKLLLFVATAIMSFGIFSPFMAKEIESIEPDNAEYEDELFVDYNNPEMRYVAPKYATNKPSTVKIHYHNDNKECKKKGLWIWADGYAYNKDYPYDKAGATDTDICFTLSLSGEFADLAKKKSLWFIVKYTEAEKGSEQWIGKSDNTELVYEKYEPDENGLVEVWTIPGEGSALEVYKSEADTKMDRVQNAVFNNWKQLNVIATMAPKAYRLYALTGSYMRMGKAEQEEKYSNYLIAQGNSPKCTNVSSGSFKGSKQFKINLNYTIKPNVQYLVECDFNNPKHSEWGDFTKTKYVAAHKLYETKRFTDYYNYDKDDLGATYNGPDSTTFRVWAPTAARVRLCLYDSGTPAKYHELYPEIEGSDDYGGYNMVFRPGGIWEVTITGRDLKNTYYNYYVVNSLGENITTDPYAKACGIDGDRGMVVDFSETNPEGWDTVPEVWNTDDLGAGVPKGTKTAYNIKAPNDLSIYEAHIRDLTMHSTWTGTAAKKGTYLGFIEDNTSYTKNATTVKTGFAHIKEMGVKAIQLTPVFDHDNIEDPKTTVFNWGYNPKNYNCVEGSYSTDPFTGTTRIKEYKQLIKAFADSSNHTRIIMDVVYNHVASATESCFHKLMPRYYFRYTEGGDFYNGSGCGNDVKTEAPMMSKYIVESLCFWAKEYKIKGFRFDLMGLIDWKTIQAAAKALYKIDPDIYLYGEGWAAGGTGNMGSGNWGTNTWTIYENFQKTDADKICWVGGFNDVGRDSLRGKNNYNEEENFNGFMTTQGGGGKAQAVADMLVGFHTGEDGGTHVKAKLDPNMCVVYASCHDNFTLFDQFYGSYIGINHGGGDGEAAAAAAAAECIVLASNGVAFIQGGEELFRTKIVTDSKDLQLGKDDIVTMGSRKISHNSYNLSDKVNAYDWSRKVDYLDKFNAIKDACNLRNTLTKYNRAELDTIKPYLESDTAELQVYTNKGRTTDKYPIWDSATAVAFKNNNFTFVLGGRTDSHLGVQVGSARRYSSNGNNDDHGGYSGTLPNNVTVWNYTTVCFEK